MCGYIKCTVYCLCGHITRGQSTVECGFIKGAVYCSTDLY